MTARQHLIAYRSVLLVFLPLTMLAVSLAWYASEGEYTWWQMNKFAWGVV